MRRDSRTLIRDDHWINIAIALIGAGGLVLWVSIQHSTWLEAGLGGATVVFLGIWILARPVGIVIDQDIRTLFVRGLISERSVMFSNLTAMQILETEEYVPIVGPPDDVRRYDLVINVRNGAPIVARSALSLASASADAIRVGGVTGLSIRPLQTSE